MDAGSTVGALEAFLAERLRRPLPGADAHWRFAPNPPSNAWSPDLLPESARRAAVLILVFPAQGGPTIPLTLRHADLPQHAAQISLPGGAIDPGESVEAAALREADEEIGVDPTDVRLLGALSPLWTHVSNFIVHPVVAVTDRRPAFRLQAGEVTALVEAPVAELRDRARLKWTRRERQGAAVDFPYFDIGGHMVWGLTAMVLGEFAALFDPAHGPPGRA